ncbi:hypothetical protein KAM348_35440 [Aeromonas caviae]|uniref:Periplasmic sensor domain-containing protein n=1 Tax=Aeromonas caviae TaxID=648 RepID=A0AAI9KUB1_AERCA|nr:hypothetical protein KAM348_35440 [Aeromonas caviae]
MTVHHATPRLTLRQSLGRTHMMISLTAVCMAGLFLTVTALLALRLYADHNLKLVARAISYTTEAAVVFHDKEAALDALETITSREDIASASIVQPDGQVLASWRRDITTPWTTLEQHLARLILPGPVVLPMVREHKEIARVHLVGHGQYLLRFLLQTLLATLVVPAHQYSRGTPCGAPDAALHHGTPQGPDRGGLQRQPPAGPQGAGAGGQYRRAARAG